MSNVINLAKYKTEKQYVQFYYENLDLDLTLDTNFTYQTQQQDIEREMRLGYMRLLTEAIEKKRKNKIE